MNAEWGMRNAEVKTRDRLRDPKTRLPSARHAGLDPASRI